VELSYSDVAPRPEATGCSPGRAASAAAWIINELEWHPIVDVYRTLCLAPCSEIRTVFEAILVLDAAAQAQKKQRRDSIWRALSDPLCR
jgi:hypothetical protein